MKIAKEQVDAIKTRYSRKNLYKLARTTVDKSIWDVVFDDVEALLIAFEAKTARANSLEAENEAWNDLDCSTCPLRDIESCDALCSSKARMAGLMAAYIKDNILLVVRSCALEKAIKSLPRQHKCLLCIHHNTPRMESPCSTCDTVSFGDSLEDLWAFGGVSDA